MGVLQKIIAGYWRETALVSTPIFWVVAVIYFPQDIADYYGISERVALVILTALPILGAWVYTFKQHRQLSLKMGGAHQSKTAHDCFVSRFEDLRKSIDSIDWQNLPGSSDGPKLSKARELLHIQQRAVVKELSDAVDNGLYDYPGFDKVHPDQPLLRWKEVVKRYWVSHPDNLPTETEVYDAIESTVGTGGQAKQVRAISKVNLPVDMLLSSSVIKLIIHDLKPIPDTPDSPPESPTA